MRVTGSYRVRVTNEHGCSAMSYPFDGTVLSLDDASPARTGATLTVYPEPATDLLRISLRNVTGLYTQLLLSDMSGRNELLHSGTVTAPDAVSSIH